MKLLIPTALALSCALCCAQAQSSEIEQLDTVSVTMVRDRAMLPYAQMNELLSGLQRYGQGLFRMDFKLASSDPKKELVAPKLALQHADAYIPIPIKSDGMFDLPVLPQAQAKDADLASNQTKGSIRVTGTLQLTTKPEALDMATVRRIVNVANKLRSELLPWYLRWLFPQIEGVRVCSAEPKWELEWREQTQLVGLPLQADPSDRDPEARKGTPSKPCATLTGQEQWPDAAKLLAPADAKLSVRLRR